MNTEDASGLHPRDASADPRQDLVSRVASSSTFGKSPRLRSFFLYVCQCALDGQPEAATEQQIGIHVFGRPAGYNPNDDNIVRSQARLLRLKLEHHFANEGQNEAIIVTIPKGRYLPAFEKRFEPVGVVAALAPVLPEPGGRPRARLAILVALALLCGIGLGLLGATLRRSLKTFPSLAGQSQPKGDSPARITQLAPALRPPEVRIATGNSAPYTDVWGRRWESDRYYEGGVSNTGPQELFPPVADAGLFKTVREAPSADSGAPQSQREFWYRIPVRPGVYELRLYFADPVRHTQTGRVEDGQNQRHFQVSANGRPLLVGFDPTADSGFAPVDVRVFRDIAPAQDGLVHLEFVPGPERPFVNAIELTPGTPGKLKPIRISAQRQGFVDSDGIQWGPDNYFIHGRTTTYLNPETGPFRVPPLYAAERFGNFSYAIPVPPGSYTVKLHFAETFFGPSIAATGLCQGLGCRVFDVTCNGVELLRDFDIVQAAGGAFRPVVRTFQGLRPNAQGKLLLSFLPKVNYAAIRAIEVIDEAK